MQSSLASVERLYSSSQSRGQGVLSGSSMRLAVCWGSALPILYPSLSLSSFSLRATPRSSHPYEKPRHFVSTCEHGRGVVFSATLHPGWHQIMASVAFVEYLKCVCMSETLEFQKSNFINSSFILINILELHQCEVVAPNNLQLCVCDKYRHVFSPSKHCSSLSRPHQRKCEYYVEMAPLIAGIV